MGRNLSGGHCLGQKGRNLRQKEERGGGLGSELPPHQLRGMGSAVSGLQCI